MSASFVGKPLPYDVLCSKNKTDANHPGNAEYKRLIKENALAYASAESKQEKTRMTTDIARELMETYNSRFLKYDSLSGEWEVLTVAMARDKISHALRTRAQFESGFKRQRSSSPSSVSSDACPYTDETNQGRKKRQRAVSIEDYVSPPTPSVDVLVDSLMPERNNEDYGNLKVVSFDFSLENLAALDFDLPHPSGVTSDPSETDVLELNAEELQDLLNL
jgi:hypothetical protein